MVQHLLHALYSTRKHKTQVIFLGHVAYLFIADNPKCFHITLYSRHFDSFYQKDLKVLKFKFKFST